MTNRPPTDRLSALLAGLAPRIGIYHAGDTCTVSSFEPTSPDQLHLHLVTQGTVCIAIDGGGERKLTAPAIAVVRADFVHSLTPDCTGQAPRLLCAQASFDGPASSLLLEAFSSPILLTLDRDDSDLDLVVRLISKELEAPRCGQPALLERAGEILFIGLLRHLVAHPKTPAGLLNGLSDARIARALVAMHQSPEANWRLEDLAMEAGMSRTAFAVGFRSVMNKTPGAYLLRLRLSIAQRAVAEGHGLKRAAAISGYASTTALSRALARATSRR